MVTHRERHFLKYEQESPMGTPFLIGTRKNVCGWWVPGLHPGLQGPDSHFREAPRGDRA